MTALQAVVEQSSLPVARSALPIAQSALPAIPAQAIGAVGFLFFLVFFVLFAIVLPYWVYTDAKSKGSDSAVLWAIIVFLAPILGLVLYLLIGDEY